MTVTVRSLLDIPNTPLTLLAGSAGLDAEVRWVHVSDVQDPTPWLQGGEVLLTTAARLPVEEAAEYTERLHRHGLAGLGFGVGNDSWMHPEVPADMIETADRLGFPVFQIPYDTPFIVIAEYVAAQQAAERFRDTQLAYRAQQQFTQIALSTDAIGGLVSRLAEVTAGWACVVTPDGDVLEASSGSARANGTAFREDLTWVRETGAVASVSNDIDGHVSIHPLGGPGRVRGMLLTGQRSSPSAFERTIAASAASLLSFIMEQRMSLSPQRMAAANLLGDTLLDPATPRERFSRAAAGLGLDARSEVTVARLSVPGVDAETVARVLHDVFSQRAAATVTVRDRGARENFTLITTSSEANRREFERLPERFGGASVRVGIGDDVRLSRLHLGYSQASLALSQTRATSTTSVVRFNDLDYYSRIVGLAQPAMVATFVATALSPLERLDADVSGGELVETLRAFLAHHGRWDPAARDLGVHRQTLVKRIARIERHLDVRLDSTDVRMGLWFAITARDAARPQG